LVRAEDLGGLVRGEAFRQLLATGGPVSGEDLAGSIGLSADKVLQRRVWSEVVEERKRSPG
jgi:hypothetical protein